MGGTIIGGYVYRGGMLGAEHEGMYIAGDFVSGRFFMIDPNAANVDASLVELTADLFPGGFASFNLGGFGEDQNGELYILARSGQVYQVIPEPAAAGALAFALLLSCRRRQQWPLKRISPFRANRNGLVANRCPASCLVQSQR